jgi:hypothetical protein
MLILEDFRSIVSHLDYKDWDFYIGGTDAHPYLQIQFLSSDNDLNFPGTRTFPADLDNSGKLTLQKGRKWQLSQHMCLSEVVRTAWKAVLNAEEHETAEQFKYKNQAIYNPHFDAEALVKFAEMIPLEVRPDNRVKRNHLTLEK